MRILIAGLLVLLAAVAAQSAIMAPQLRFAPRTELRTSNDWTLRISRSKLHENVIVLSVSGSTADSKRERVSLVFYCLDKDFFGVSFIALPDDDRFKLLSDQDARYKLRDDIERKMPVVPVEGFAAEYEAYLRHLEPPISNANLVMIKYPGHANSLLFNSRKGGWLQISMNDRYGAEFHLRFEVDGLAELHDTVRRKCGW
ncbi:hypothetical protein [Roseibium sp. SCP14]|uniref:hypothetical protein n=1 Tax=Roseibium sp. SCP14 TaxID=3141375 RepID=UPI00333B4407